MNTYLKIVGVGVVLGLGLNLLREPETVAVAAEPVKQTLKVNPNIEKLPQKIVDDILKAHKANPIKTMSDIVKPDKYYGSHMQGEEIIITLAAKQMNRDQWLHYVINNICPSVETGAYFFNDVKTVTVTNRHGGARYSLGAKDREPLKEACNVIMKHPKGRGFVWSYTSMHFG